MGSFPTGTVTFLFTDIQGSTKLWQTKPEAMKQSQARHNAILREAIESSEGYLFQVVGDAFCAAFSSTENAIQAAIKSQSALHAEPWGEAAIRVRMGIHTGKADLQEDGLYSGYVSLCRVQRIMSAGHGGQTLLSSTTEPLMRECLPPEVSLQDLGEHRLKDLPQPEHLYQLLIPDLPADFPPLRTLDLFPNNLPLQLTSFIGREKELADVKQLLCNTRLLTLAGPGGTGKSRLSLQAAADLLHTFPQGAWLVELAPVSDPYAVPRSVLAALNLPAEVHRPAIEMLCDYLQDKETLIILDNCEHLVEACAQLVDRLLHAASKLRILISSREALGIGGEISYRVPSLGLPDLKSLPALDSLIQCEAVRLFIERARASLPDFHVTDENAPAVVQICHRLDGIPLAIELAAAKVRLLSVDQIAHRLDDRFRLLTGGSRTALERHQTLRAALDWSYNILPHSEQVLFHRLSIFVNGWTLEAAESVCAGEVIRSEEIFDLLDGLVNKSLVSANTMRNETRYGMLETMRQYAGEKLIETGESELLRDRHLEYYLDLAETAAPHLLRPEQVDWLDHLEWDNDNLRTALEWSLGKTRPGQALRLAAALGDFWNDHCYWKEGSRWLERAFAMPFNDPTPFEKAARVRALHQDVWLSDALDNIERLLASAEASVALCQEGTEDRLGLAISQLCLGYAYHRISDRSADAIRLLEQSLAEFRELGDSYRSTLSLLWIYLTPLMHGEQNIPADDSRILEMTRRTGERRLIGGILLGDAGFAFENDRLGEANALAGEAARLYQELGYRVPVSDLQGKIAHARKDFRQAKKLYSEAIAAYELIGEKWLKSQVFMDLAILEGEQGDLAEAQTLMEQALTIARETNNSAGVVLRLALLGQIHFLRGIPEEAETMFRESLFHGISLENMVTKAWSLIPICSYLASHHPRVTAQLLSVVHSENAKLTAIRALNPLNRSDFDDALARARLELGEAEFRAAWADGERLSIKEACDLALKALDAEA